MFSYISRLREYSMRNLIRRDKNCRVPCIDYRTSTVIADDLIIDGSLVSSGDVYLLGHVKGDVTCSNVFFGERGAVDGAIRVGGQSDTANNHTIRAANVHFT